MNMEPTTEFLEEGRPRILVVDDSPENLLAYRTTLSGNYDVLMVSSGRDALKYLMNEEFALVLLDVVMPDMDGFETAGLIRRRKKTSALPIIFVSAFPPDDIQTFNGYAMGAADFISTPLNPEILRAKVAAFINLYNYNRAKEALLQREMALQIERKENEKKLLEARRKAELLKQQREYEIKTAEIIRQKSKELEQFAYVASHDLKAPLRTISNYLELFYQKYRGKIDIEADQYIQFVVAGAKKLNRLIDDLLSYSRVGSGLQNMEECDLNEALKDVVNSLDAQIKENDATITWEELPKFPSDRTLILQLFQNLISNAITYRGEDAPKIHISCAKEEGTGWIFSVRDNGMGFDMKYASQIFEMFKSLSRDDQGTGIGLAICKRIVERHGGAIWAESKVGEGSIFSFSIPNRSEEKMPLKGMQILVVDDAPDVRAVSSRILSLTGAHCDCVDDGRTALEKVKTHLYDVILMDIRMPEMDGYETKDRLRKMGCASPIVAFSTMEKSSTYAEEGFSDFLRKESLKETLLPFLMKYRPKNLSERASEH